MDSQDDVTHQFCNAVNDMSKSMSSVREVVKSLRDKANTDELDTKDGISLLSLKHHLLLSYLQSLTLVLARRAMGHSLDSRSPPDLPFSSADREPRGSGAGDLVDSMIETRIVLEKIKTLEGRMRYQIEKLVNLAHETPSSSNKKTIDDPLSFRPNPQNLMNAEDSGSADERDDGDTNERSDHQGIYRPPRVAAMPYTGGPRDKKSRRQPVPSALDALARQDPYQPHIESTSGLGSAPSLSSNRAREIQRMTEFEEENFTRIVMKKKDMKRRRRDEEDIALGGSGGLAGMRRGGGGFEAELGDVLRSVGRSRSGVVGDGYEELRKKGRRGNVLDRSKTRTRDEAFENMGDDAPRLTKRSRFEKAAKAAKKKLLKSRK